jgi:hypothetical protein
MQALREEVVRNCLQSTDEGQRQMNKEKYKILEGYGNKESKPGRAQ